MELPCDKIFHNAAYDVGWLRWWGVEVKGKIIDTLIAAPLIDENRFRYSLNELGKDYLKETSQKLYYMKPQENGASMQKHRCINFRQCMLVRMLNKTQT